MISVASRYYGVVLHHLLDTVDGPARIRRAFPDCAGFYILDEATPLFIKYTTKRLGPWTFNFHHDHQLRQQLLFERLGECIMVFVCGRDGIAALRHKDLRMVLDDHFEEQETVTVRRRHNTMYQIRGRDGQLDFKVSRNSLTDIISNLEPARLK